LFQTNFFPDLTHVNFLPEAVDVAPAFEQTAPAFTAPIAGDISKELKNATETTRARVFFMVKMVLSPIGFVRTFY
jgi:hypothetical protein